MDLREDKYDMGFMIDTDKEDLGSFLLKISVYVRAIRVSEIFTTDFTDEHG